MSQNAEKEELTLWETVKVLFGASKAFWLVNMVNLLDGISYFGILSLLTRFLGQNLQMPDKVVGPSVSGFSAGVTLFMVGAGILTDRLGVRRALTWSLGITGVGRALLTLSPAAGPLTWYVAWFALLLMAFGTAALQPALYAGVKEYADPRTATIGFSVLYAIMNLGIVGEYVVSPFIRSKEIAFGVHKVAALGWGIDGVFWFCTAVTGVAMLLHLTFFTKRLEIEQRVVEPEEEDKEPKGCLDSLMSIPITDLRFVYFIFILLPVRTLFAHQFLTIPDYVFRCFPTNVNDKFEWINIFNPLIIVIFVPLIAAATRRMKVIDMMIIGTTVSALTTFILVSKPSLERLLIYMIVFSLGEAAWSSRFLEYVADLAPPGKVGAYMGFAGLPWFLAKFTTGLYSGSMLSHFIPEKGPQDPATMWLIYAFIACISPIGLLLGRKWILQGEHHSKTGAEE